jgi:hypothetical protein
VSPSTTFSTSITFSNAQTRANDQAISESRSIAASRTVTATGAFLKVAAVVQNRSDVAFRVINLTIGASFVDPSGAVLSVHDLDPDEGVLTTFQAFALAPGEQTGIINFISTPTTVDTGEAILARADQLNLSLSVYEIDDSSGKAFAFDLDAVNAKTALLAIDYGGTRSPEFYQVATNSNPAHPGVTASTIFNDILRIPYTADPQTGLTAVRDIGVNTSGGPHWSVLWMHRDGPDVTSTPFGADGEPYDFDGITVRAGDVLQLTGPGTPPNADAGLGGPNLGSGPSGVDDAGVATLTPTVDGGPPFEQPDLPDANLTPTAPAPSVSAPSAPPATAPTGSAP